MKEQEIIALIEQKKKVFENIAETTNDNNVRNRNACVARVLGDILVAVKETKAI